MLFQILSLHPANPIIEDGKRFVTAALDGALEQKRALMGGTVDTLASLQRSGANLFGWINDASAPMSCSQYTHQGKTCPLAPQYPTDANFQLYRYKAGPTPVLGHCTLYKDRCVGRMGYYGLFRQGTPTYKQLLAETKAHLRRLG